MGALFRHPPPAPFIPSVRPLPESKADIYGRPKADMYIQVPKQTCTGAPCSHQRTWAENDTFRMLSLSLNKIIGLSSRSYGGASPKFPVKVVCVCELHAAFLSMRAHVTSANLAIA